MAKKKKIEKPVILSEAEQPGLRADQYEVLVSSIRRIENSLTGIDRDLEHDREDLQDFKVRLGTLEGHVRELRKAMNLNAERVKDKVADVVEPMQKEVSGAVDELQKAVEKKRVLLIDRKGFFSRLFGRK